MQLVLVRHAVAKERDAHRWPDDNLRPLTAEGRRKFRRVALGIRRALPSLDVLLSSGLTRAEETARILRQEARWPEPELLEALAPGHTAVAIVEAVRRRARAGVPKIGPVATIALVGHEPQMSQLLSALLAQDAAVGCDFRKGAIAVVDFDGLPKAGHGRLLWFAPPALVRALRRRQKS